MISTVKNSALAWTLAVLSVTAAVVLLMRLLHTAVEIPVAAAASTGISLGFGLLFLCVIVALDRTKLHRMAGTKTMWAWAVVAGGLIGPLIAIYSNDKFDFEIIRVSDPETYRAWGDAVYGPLVEEWIKGVLALAVILLFRERIVRPTQAFFIGAFTGLGFQVTEDIWYAITSAYVDVNSDLSGGVALSLVRGLFGLISHWTYTGVVAAGLAYLLGVTFHSANGAPPRRGRAIVRAIGLCALAYLTHGLWNSPLTFGLPAVATTAAKLTISLTAFVIFYVWLMRHEKRTVAYAQPPKVTEA